MPHKPKRPCRYPGCPNLCETGTYCEVHRKEWSPESLRGNAAARGYDAKWREARRLFSSLTAVTSICSGIRITGRLYASNATIRRQAMACNGGRE